MTEGMSEGMQRYIAEAVAREIQDRAAKGIGNLSSHITDWAAETLRPVRIPWERKLKVSVSGQIIAVRGKAKASFDQPNRRFQHTEFIIPGRRAVDPNVLVGIDVSGSMLDGSLDMAVAQTTSILRARGVKKIRISEVDVIAKEARTKRGRTVGNLDTVGGGTNMTLFFDAIRDMPFKQRPTNAILFTDGWTAWPEEADFIPGVKFLVGVVCDESGYDRLIQPLPKWIEPVFIPKDIAS